MSKKPFAISAGDRVRITNKQREDIKKLYREAAKEVGERARFYKGKDNISSIMRARYMSDLQKDLTKEMHRIDTKTESIILNNMLNVSKSVMLDNRKLLSKMGFDSSAIRDYHIPKDVINQVATGKLYVGKWSLSSSIWSDDREKLDDINSIIAKGIAENKSAYDLAKDLESYVNPDAKKSWPWSKAYPGSRKVIDYNAQRLARTMVSHAYEESFVRATKDNPFIEAYQWLSSGGDRMCEICAERDGKIYAKDELPLDHPNGMCTFSIVMSKSYNQIGQDLANWVNGEGNEKLNLEIDDFAQSLFDDGKTLYNPQISSKEAIVSDSIYKLSKKK